MKLRNCEISDPGFQAIIESKHLRSLEVLALSKNQIKDLKTPFSGAKNYDTLYLAKYQMKLQVLDLSDNLVKQVNMAMYPSFLANTVVIIRNSKNKTKKPDITKLLAKGS